MLTQDFLKKELEYFPDTGFFVRKISKSARWQKGQICGSLNCNGYIQIYINKNVHLAHRLAWLYMTGSMPKNQIDHINRNKSDNSWNNLREANNAQNSMNVGLQKNNKSGFKGVSWYKGRWVASAKLNYKQYYLGRFKTKEEASFVYQKFVKKHYGEFCF